MFEAFLGKLKSRRRKGRRENVRVFEFLRDPLTNAFGHDFYEALEAAATHILSQDDSPRQDQ